MSQVIVLPLNEILKLVAILTTIEDTVNFIFNFVLNCNWRWWGWSRAIDIVAMPGGEVVNIKNWVLMHRGGKSKLVGEIAYMFDNFIGAKLMRVKFSARRRDRDIL